MTNRQATKGAGVFGWPVHHSLSPCLHGHWIGEHSLNAAYVPFAVSPDALPRALSALADLGISGVNLTIPHKETALLSIKTIDAAARAIGAINTVIVQPDGALLGRNTDAYGFAESLRGGGIPDARGETGIAVVLGAGGAARAVLFALMSMGYREIRVLNRTIDRAQIMCRDFAHLNTQAGFSVRAWGTWLDALAGADLLVNTTALGMTGQPELDINLASLPATAAVVDIVYRPLKTMLLKQAEARGHRIVDGLGMLMHQAVPAFEAWFGVRPAVTPALRQVLLSAMAPREL